MNLIVLQEFFSDYSIGTIVTAVVISIITYLISKLSFPKVVKVLTYFLPFVLGIIIQYVCSIVNTGSWSFSYAILSAGIMSGSLSFAIKMILHRIFRGDKLPTSKRSIIITGLIDGYVKKDSVDVVVNLIERVFIEKGENPHVEKSEIITEIAFHIEQNVIEGTQNLDATALASLIFASVKQMAEDGSANIKE